jgi:hypothetical protein
MYINDFENYLLDLNDLVKMNSRKFFMNLDKLVHYKKKVKIVDCVKEAKNDKVKSASLLMDYYMKLFKTKNTGGFVSNNTFEPIFIDVNRGTRNLAHNKAVG